MQNYTYSSGDEVFVWHKKIENNTTGEFVTPFTLLHNDERYKIVVIDQVRVFNRYSTSQIISSLEQPSMLDDSIIER